MDTSVPENIKAAADAVINNLLPEKSAEKYLETYRKFMEWKKRENIDEANFSGTVLLAYFYNLSKKYKSSSLWAFYSMLRTTIERNNNVNIKYAKLISFLKKTGIGYMPKKSEVFTADEIGKFLSQAGDKDFLVMKVVMIFGLYGALRGEELTKLMLRDVNRQGEIFIITIRETKTHIVRKFTIEGEYAIYVRKYMEVRSYNVTTERFFLNYRNGRCTAQPIGKNKFLAMPKLIASFLELPNEKSYTGHSFRRTSATLVANGGGSMTDLMRLGGWKSTNTVDGYIADSVANKRKIGGLISKQINLPATIEELFDDDPFGDVHLDAKELCLAESQIIALPATNTQLTTTKNVLAEKQLGDDPFGDIQLDANELSFAESQSVVVHHTNTPLTATNNVLVEKHLGDDPFGDVELDANELSVADSQIAVVNVTNIQQFEENNQPKRKKIEDFFFHNQFNNCHVQITYK